jgi:hypothetical protein
LRRRSCHLPAAVTLLLILSLGTAHGTLPAAAHADVATPAAVPVDPGSLTAMLGHVPAVVPGLAAPESVNVAYADLAGQLAAVGVTPPDTLDHDGFVAFSPRWSAATAMLETPGRSREDILSEDWRASFGFDITQVDQIVEVTHLGESPSFRLTLYRGRFDQAAVRSSLEGIGYRPFDAGGAPAWSVRGDYEWVDPGSGVGRFGYDFGMMNYATLLPDGILAFAPTAAAIEAVLAVAAKNAPALTDRSDVAVLLAHAPADLAWALMVDGAKLARAPELASFFATPPPPPGQLPPVSLALLGLTAGGPLSAFGEATPEPLPPGVPAVDLVLALLMGSPADAAAAAPVVEERLATHASRTHDRPFAELFPVRSVRAVPHEPVLLIELSLGVGVPPRTLVNLWYDWDLAFVR